MSPRTKSESDVEPETSVARFRVDEKGFFPKRVEEAFELRDEVDKELEKTEPGTENMKLHSSANLRLKE